MSSWYKKGKDGINESQKKDAEAKAKSENRKNQKPRFWLRNDTSAKITWLDSPNFFFSEHNIKIGNRFGNYFTCLSDLDICPLCESGDIPSYILAATIIDHSIYRTDDGKEYRDQKKLFVAKGKARQGLLRQIERRDGNLQYTHYEMSRGSGSTECSTGEDFEYIKKLSRKAIEAFVKKAWDRDNKKYTGEDIKEFLTPYNYEEIFKPKSVEDLRKIAGGEVPVGSENSELFDGSDKEANIEGETETVDDEIKDIEDLL